MAPKPRPIDLKQVLDLAARSTSFAQVARNMDWAPNSLRSRLDDGEGTLDRVMALLGSSTPPPAESEGITENDNGTKTGVIAQGWTAEQVIEHFGDDPAECIITTPLSATLWGNPEEPQERLKVSWVRKADTIQPVDPGSWTPPPKPKKPRKDRERDVILTSDHHAPLHDKTLHSRTLDLLADEQPAEGVLMGDLMDFSTISRFRDKDGFAHSVQSCLDAAFGILRDYREASPNTRWTMLPGNHDCRLHYAIIDNAKALHRIAPACETRPSLDFRRLLHLDELGIDFIDEDWESAKFSISRKLTVRHGYTTAKNAGDKMLTKLTRSTVQGHSHRLSLTLRTEHDDDPDEPTKTRLAAEVGCMCEIKDGLGHAVDPDWQQGLVMAHIWPDGDFHLTPYFYVPGRLLGPGKRYV